MNDFDLATDKKIEKEQFTEDRFFELISKYITDNIVISEDQGLENLILRVVVCPDTDTSRGKIQEALLKHKAKYENSNKKLEDYVTMIVDAAEYFGCLEG